MGYTRIEQETTINYNAEEKAAEIYTADPSIMRKLKKLNGQYPDVYVCKELKEFQAKYMVPKKYIRFGKPPSEARIEASRRNAENMRNNTFTNA
jgi:hypothetical protein